MRPFHLFALVVSLSLFLILAPTRTAAEEPSIAYRGARILTAAGAPIDKGVLIVRKDKIVAVGAGAFLQNLLPLSKTGDLFSAGTVPVINYAVGRAGKPLLSALHAVHSGHVGDYVVWIVVGAAVLGGFCALLAAGS